VLNVAGHARLQDAAWVEQFDMHASEEASANRLLVRVDPVSANAVPRSTNRYAVVKMNLTRALLMYSGQQLLNSTCPKEPVVTPAIREKEHRVAGPSRYRPTTISCPAVRPRWVVKITKWAIIFLMFVGKPIRVFGFA